MNESKLFTTGQRQVERGQHRAAAQTYAKLLEQDPDNVQALLFLGDVYHRLEDEPRAADAFVRAAEVYSRQGDALKALTVHRQAVELLPGSPEAHAALGHLCLQQGKGAEAMDAFGRAMECFEERGGRLGGLRLIYDILKSGSGDLPSWLRVGEGFSALGHVKEASRALRVLALRLHGENRKDAFRLVAERLLYHDANESAVARRLAESYLRDGLATRALPALRIACRAAPRDLELLGLLRDALVSLGHEDNAVVVLKTMARLYEEAGHLAERDTCYDQILDLRPDDEGVRHAMDPPRTVGDMPTIVLEPAAPVVRPPTLTKAQEMAFAPAEQGFGEPVTAQVVSVEEEGLEAPITAQVVSVEQMGTHAPVTSRVVAADVWGDSEAVVDAPGVSETAGPLTAPVIQVTDLPGVVGESGAPLNTGSIDRILQEGAALAGETSDEVDDLVSSVVPSGDSVRDIDALFAVTHAVLDHHAPPTAVQRGSDAAETEVHEVLARELEELDFYISQGLDDEAGVLVAELRERYGDHPAVRERALLMQSAEKR